MSADATAALSGKRIVLGVTGSIAAYKAVLLMRLLQKAGAQVRVVLTEGARQFVTARTFSGLGATVHTDLWEGPGELHVDLARWADAVLVAPITADTMARLATGRADDLLTSTVLTTVAPVCLAPAMHPAMWRAPVTLENAKTLFRRGMHFFGPVSGEVASGEVGVGRFQEPEDITLGLARVLYGPGSLSGRHVVVTAGPTVEAIDPVRTLSNISSGKMGYAVAEILQSRGAQVTLISGPVALPAPPGIKLVPVQSALDLQSAVLEALGPELDGADALVMAAAVSDYRPVSTSAEKLKRSAEGMHLSLVQNPDILADLGRMRGSLRPVLIGFALETADGDALINLGRRKLINKRVDLIVANSASRALGRDDNEAMLISPIDCIKLPRMSKSTLAVRIVEWLEHRLEGPPRAEQTD
jgi:phosphopantothenoylcysteine decarboxylase / phosphopantothenate---cysteine ligase